MPATVAVSLSLESAPGALSREGASSRVGEIGPPSRSMPPRPVTIGARRPYAPTDAVRREIKFHGAFVCESDRRFVDWKRLKVKRASGNRVNGKNRGNGAKWRNWLFFFTSVRRARWKFLSDILWQFSCALFEKVWEERLIEKAVCKNIRKFFRKCRIYSPYVNKVATIVNNRSVHRTIIDEKFAFNNLSKQVLSFVTSPSLPFLMC